METIYLPQSPYFQFASNPYTDPLVENWTVIRDQFFESCQIKGERDSQGWTNSNSSTKPNGTTWASNDAVLYTGAIKCHSLMLKSSQLSDYEKTAIGWRDDEDIRWMTQYKNTQSVLYSYTEQHADVIGAVTFITSFPGAKLTHHWGCDSVDYTRVHLCLDEAAGCVFNIEGWEHTWHNGECFGFDDGYVLHGTLHNGTKPRTILSIDILSSAIQPWVTNWYCRRPRPSPDAWALLHEECKKIKPGM